MYRSMFLFHMRWIVKALHPSTPVPVLSSQKPTPCLTKFNTVMKMVTFKLLEEDESWGGAKP